MLTIDEIDKVIAKLPKYHGRFSTKDPNGQLNYYEFASAIEREATIPLVEQIKEDGALMRQALIAMYSSPNDDGSFTPEYRCAIEVLRKRLEAKK